MKLLDQPASFEIRKGESFKFAREIHKPYGELDRILEWCKHELTDEWRWQLIDHSTDTRPGRYIFYFDSNRDCFAFSLQWA
jgi:hypothetical protein